MKVAVLVTKTALPMMKMTTVYEWRWKRAWKKERLGQHHGKRSLYKI